MDITVCIGSSCHLKGSREIVSELQTLLKEYDLQDKVELNGSFCMGQCVKGVCTKVDGELFSLSPGETKAFFEREILRRLNA